jgi:coproporphyrinogen III oxidase-like Fe-S oxidoreductase
MNVTRLSAGVQSVDDRVLRTVGRAGSESVFRGLEAAFSAGLTNVNADIIV